MTIFSPQKFHQKAKNPRKRPILSKFVVPKVPEVYSLGFDRAQDRTDDPNPALHFLHFSHHLLCSLHHYNGLFVRLTAWKRHKNGIKLRKWQNFKVCSAPCTIFFFWSALHPVKICSVFSSNRRTPRDPFFTFHFWGEKRKMWV